jgi:hypothetical protein
MTAKESNIMEGIDVSIIASIAGSMFKSLFSAMLLTLRYPTPIRNCSF